MNSRRCLVVEDEDDIAQVVELILQHDGFRVTRASNGEDAIDLCREVNPDLVILDLELPGINGQETARRMRDFTDSYIVILSGRGSTEDRIDALSSSADDYISKPFERGELIARIRALFRRPRGLLKQTEPAAARIAVNPSARTVEVDGTQLNLTSLEFELLAQLVRAMPEAVTKESLIASGWRDSRSASPHILNVHIHNIRRKIGAITADLVVESARGVGFRLIDKTA